MGVFPVHTISDINAMYAYHTAYTHTHTPEIAWLSYNQLVLPYRLCISTVVATFSSKTIKKCYSSISFVAVSNVNVC